MHKWSALKQKICPSCRHYQPAQATCALLTNGAQDTQLTELLSGQRCDPERFLRTYVTRYITAKYGAELLECAEPAIRDVLAPLRALEPGARPDDGAVNDLGSFREWLISFAHDRVAQYVEHIFARPTCGLCEHYSRTQPAVCRLQYAPDAEGKLQTHPWFAHQLPSGQDPQALEPPCTQFSSDAFSAFRRWAAPLAHAEAKGHGTRNPFDALKPEDLAPMLSSFLERLERRSLRTAYIVRKVFFYGRSPDEVARELGTHGWVVRRELDLSLDLLHQLLKQCKLDDPGRTPGEVIKIMQQLGQSRTTHYLLENHPAAACPPRAQLDAYYADQLTGPLAIAVGQHLGICDPCARELLLREQITADLVEDEAMELMKEVYATEKSFAPAVATASDRSRSPWRDILAERRVFVGVAAALLLALFLLFLWARAR